MAGSDENLKNRIVAYDLKFEEICVEVYLID
jgi:hypothetical protein